MHAPPQAAAKPDSAPRPVEKSAESGVGSPQFMGGAPDASTAPRYLTASPSDPPIAAATSPLEAEADRAADRINTGGGAAKISAVAAPRTVPIGGGDDLRSALSGKGGGQPLDPAMTARAEQALQTDLSGVRVHQGSTAARAAANIGATAFTYGKDIWLGAKARADDAGLMAHELTHVAQQSLGEPLIQRQTAAEVVEAHEDWGGLNLREEALGVTLAGYARAGNYSFVTEVMAEVDFFNKEEVAGPMLRSFTPQELIAIARDPAGSAMLTSLAGDVFHWFWGGERTLNDLVQAVMGSELHRKIWNGGVVREIAAGGANDLEGLAALFQSDEIIDDQTVASRLQQIIQATEHMVIPGLQTGVKFGDEGFDPQFEDPHPSSVNQVGHFLTAVGLQFSPEVVSQDIPLMHLITRPGEEPITTIRAMVGAPAGMPDREVALRLTIGHEKGADPSGLAAGINILGRGLFESLAPGPDGETDEQREERVGRAVTDELYNQIEGIIAAFRTQFNAATDEDLAAWEQALADFDAGGRDNIDGALSAIDVDPSLRGNSMEDMRLSLIGWRLGEKIAAGEFASRAAVAAWIRANLGPAP